ncbi:MAG: replication protein [Clostridiaceae bacterium]|nr:replication protein [Clostridiaceae bacterium]
MKGPQLEDGFTRIANEILERISKITLNGTQFRILMVVWRYTYGFNRKEHDLSQNFIAEASGLSERQVRRELKRLIEMKIIHVVKEATFTTARVLAFNKYFDKWQVTSQTTGDEIDPSTEDESDHTPGDEIDHTPPDGLDPQERQYKDNIIDSTKDNTSLLRKEGTDGAQPPTKETPPTNQQIIAELTEKYRTIGGIKSEKSDYAFIGNCYNRYGYATVLEAIHTLQTRIAAGFKPDKPKIYLLGILKGGNNHGRADPYRKRHEGANKKDSILDELVIR